MVAVLVGMMVLSTFAQKSVIRFLTDETDPKSIKVYAGMEERFEKAYPQYDLQIEYISLSDVWPKLMAHSKRKPLQRLPISIRILWLTLSSQGTCSMCSTWLRLPVKEAPAIIITV